MDPAPTLGNGSGPSCLPQTLHLLEEEKTTLKNMTRMIKKTKRPKQMSKKFKTNTKPQTNKQKKGNAWKYSPCFTKIRGTFFKNLIFLQSLTLF